jgi:hypothetical protein
MKILENNFAEVTFESNIFKVNILDSYPTIEEWTDCKDALENFYQAIEIKQLNFTVIYDISNLGMLPYTYIKELTDILLKYKDMTETLVIASIIIVNNKLIKNIVNTMFSLYPSERPIRIVNSFGEAKEFIEEFTK